MQLFIGVQAFKRQNAETISCDHYYFISITLVMNVENYQENIYKSINLDGNKNIIHLLTHIKLVNKSFKTVDLFIFSIFWISSVRRK